MYAALTIFIIAFIIITDIDEYYHRRSDKNVFLFVTFSACALVMGLRADSVGADTGTYHKMFDYVAQTPVHLLVREFYFESMEVGYVLLMKLSSFVVNDYHFFQFVASTLFCLLAAKFIKDNSYNYKLLTIIFLGTGGGTFLPSTYSDKCWR